MGLIDFSDPHDSCIQTPNNSDEKYIQSFIDGRYPGGRQALRYYIARSARFPAYAAQTGQSGFSVSSVTITPLGKIDNISIHHSLGEVLDKAVLDLLHSTEGRWNTDHTISKNQSIYFQIIFTYKSSAEEERTYLKGDSILDKVIVAALGPPKYKTSKSLYKRLQKNLEKEKYARALEDLEVCISRDPFNIHYRELAVKCYEGIGDDVKKRNLEERLQGIEKEGLIALLGDPDVHGNIKIIDQLKNGTYSIAELTRDSTLIYTGRLQSVNPEVKHGKFYFYNSQGKISATGQYESDIPIGVWVYYNESQDTVFATNYNKVLNFILQEENAPINQEPLYLCEIMPEFNGGDPAVEFNKYLSENLNYPAFPMAKGIEGRIIIQFMVDHTGKVRDPQIVRGVQNDLNLEALRVISESPKWTPGKQRNEPTDILYTWPISFQLYKHDH